jgi:DNA-binding CsgD family transcriptional regulator
MKQSHALAYLRQLCGSGLGKEIVIPEFLRAVQTVIPSSNNVFSGCDEHFVPSYHLLGFVAPDINELAPILISSLLTLECRSRSAEWFSQHPVLTDVTLWDESFYKCDLYNLVWRSYDQHHVLQAPVTQNDKFVGVLSLYRPRPQKPFDSYEQSLCLRLLPYVTHALQALDDNDIQYSENGLSGMIIMDTKGTLVYQSPEAKQLLALACYPVLTVDARRKEEAVLAKLAQLCRNLEAIFQGQHVAPPSWSHTSTNGRFIFRAYWLNRQNQEPGSLIGVTIEHQEPKVLNILRSLQSLPLSPMQKEVALLLAQGYSADKIGQRLHIKLTTVKDHIRKIYVKLDIHQRDELMPKLLALDSSIHSL